MVKVIWQILKLLWKVFRTVIWKWLKPFLSKAFIALLMVVGIIVTIVMLTRGC